MTSRSQTSTTDIWADLDGSAALDRYRELASLMDAGFYQLNSSSEFVAVSDALLAMTGYARDEVLGEPLSFLFQGENVAEIERDVHNPQGTENETITTTVSARRRDSRRVPCELRISCGRTDDTSQVTIGIARRLSEPDGLPDRDVISTDDLSTVLTEVEGGLFILGSDFEVVWASETIGRYFGVDPETLVGRDKRGLVRDVLKQRVAEPEAFENRLFSAYDDNSSVAEFVSEITAGQNRSQRWLKHRSKPIESGLHAGGRIESYTEVTEQKEAAETLQETEQRFDSLVDAVREYAIFRVDLDGNVVSWNEGAKNIKGYEAAEIIGTHISAFYTETERSDGVPEQNLAAAARQGSIDEEGWRVRKDGSRFWANVTITTVRDDDGTHRGYLKVTRDMTDRHEHEQDLESELQRILSRISDAFYAVDEEWQFTHVNEQAEKLLQHPREELLGRNLWEMFPEASDNVVWDRFQEAMETQEPVSFEVEYDALDIWAEASAYPSESGLSVYFRDITDRLEKQRQIREREQQLSEYKKYTDKILNTIDDLFYVIGEDGTFDRWNESFETVTGYSGTELQSMQPTDFFQETDRETIDSAIEEVYETGNTRLETEIVTGDGELIPMEFAASAVRSPTGEEVIAGIGRDIVEQLKREQALQDSNERLEQFAHAASHDLQEPLRMVSSYLRLIDRHYRDILDDDGQEFLAYAVDGADRMRDMIDSLLEYSRIESKGRPFEPVDLNGVLEDARDDLRVAIEEHDAEITTENLPPVKGDGRQLRQLFQNLLDNAMEYSGEQSPRIDVSAQRRAVVRGSESQRTNAVDATDQWVLSVRDEGVGIDPADQERVFQVFQSLDRPGNHGSGIGLALCKRIVERHGGTIWVDSTPGEGTTVSFTLPAAGDADE